MKNYRWVVALAGISLMQFISYVDRVNLSVSAPSLMKEFNLSGTEMGGLFAAMMPTYIIFSFVGGYLADRFGAWRVSSIAFVVWSAATAWFGACTSVFQMWMSRLVFGASEGAFPPAAVRFECNWMLPNERGRSHSIMTAATLMGLAIGAPICGYIVNAYGWRPLFYGLGILGLVSVGILSMFLKNSPKECHRVSVREREFIEKALEDERLRKGDAAGAHTTGDVVKLLKNPYLWLFVFGYVTVVTIWWANMSWLPGYLVKEKGFTVFKSGVWSAFPFLMGAIGVMTGGLICDKFLFGKRLAYVILCQFAAPPIIFLALGATTDMAILLGFAVAMFFSAGSMGQYWALTMDLFPAKLAGTTAGIMSGIGLIAASFAPVAMGRIYDVTHSFYWGFGSVALLTFSGAIICMPLLAYEKKLHRDKAGDSDVVCEKTLHREAVATVEPSES
jgi:sugar phosphate permease